jgi:hypothetical protein
MSVARELLLELVSSLSGLPLRQLSLALGFGSTLWTPLAAGA